MLRNLRKLGQMIVTDPLDHDLSHALVVGEKKKSTKQAGSQSSRATGTSRAGMRKRVLVTGGGRTGSMGVGRVHPALARPFGFGIVIGIGFGIVLVVRPTVPGGPCCADS